MSDNFKELPQATQDLVRTFIQEVGDDIESSQEAIYSFDSEIVDMPSKSYDGLMCFINGGLGLCHHVSLRHAESSGYIPVSIQPYIDQAEKDIQEAMTEHLNKPYDYDYDALSESDQSTYDEIRDGHLEDCYFYNINAYYYSAENSWNSEEQDSIRFKVAINDDFGYGREKYDRSFYTRVVKIADLNKELIQAMIKEAIACIK